MQEEDAVSWGAGRLSATVSTCEEWVSRTGSSSRPHPRTRLRPLRGGRASFDVAGEGEYRWPSEGMAPVPGDPPAPDTP